MSGQHYTFDDKQWQGCAKLEQLQVHENSNSVRWEHCIMLWLVCQHADLLWQTPSSTPGCQRQLCGIMHGRDAGRGERLPPKHAFRVCGADPDASS